MDGRARKDAIRNFKEAKPRRGIFAVRCMSSGRVWVGSSRNLGATHNQFWFSLGQGSHPNQKLQKEWNTWGSEAFGYEVLEQLEEEVSALELSDILKQKTSYWIGQLQGVPV